MERQTNKTVKSPCIGTCLYDPSESACLGCHRTPAEITDWFIMTNEQKLAVLEKINDRVAGNQISSN